MEAPRLRNFDKSRSGQYRPWMCFHGRESFVSISRLEVSGPRVGLHWLEERITQRCRVNEVWRELRERSMIGVPCDHRLESKSHPYKKTSVSPIFNDRHFRPSSGAPDASCHGPRRLHPKSGVSKARCHFSQTTRSPRRTYSISAITMPCSVLPVC